MRRILLSMLLAGASAAAQEAPRDRHRRDSTRCCWCRDRKSRARTRSARSTAGSRTCSPRRTAGRASRPSLAATPSSSGAPARAWGRRRSAIPTCTRCTRGASTCSAPGECLRAFQAAPRSTSSRSQPPLARSAEAERRASELLDKAVAWIGGEERLRRLTGYELRTRAVETRPAREIEISRHTTALLPASIRDEAVTPWGEMTQVVAPDGAFQVTPHGARPLHPLQRQGLETAQRRLPLVILRSRREPGFVAVYAGPGRAGDAAVEEVELDLASARLRLGIEAATGRILSLDYPGRHPGGEVGRVVELFSDYRSTSGLMLPYRSAATVDGAAAAGHERRSRRRSTPWWTRRSSRGRPHADDETPPASRRARAPGRRLAPVRRAAAELRRGAAWRSPRPGPPRGRARCGGDRSARATRRSRWRRPASSRCRGEATRRSWWRSTRRPAPPPGSTPPTATFSSEYDMQHGPGPHATPLVAGGRVFAAGATGVLQALDQATGRLLWRRDLIGELGGTLRPNGYACSPIAFGDTVIVFVGRQGPRGGGVPPARRKRRLAER